MTRILKPGGLVVIQEINTSLMMRAALRLMNHEGWSYDVNVFDPSREVNDPRDPWSANCAVPWLLFHDMKKFTEHFPQFECHKNELCECFMLLASGGVIAKAKTIPLPGWMLDAIDTLDGFLVSGLPGVFAMGQRVVLQLKKKL